MGKQLILENYDVVSIPKEDAIEIAEYLEEQLDRIKKDRWIMENGAKLAIKANLERWSRMLKRLA